MFAAAAPGREPMINPVAVMVVTIAVAAGQPARATTEPALPRLVVRIYDSSGLAGRDMKTAAATVRAAFRRAGMDAVWLDCSLLEAALLNSACQQPVGPAEVVVRIIRAKADRTDRALGYTRVFEAGSGGWLATVLGDRVNEVARRADIDAGTLLGRVIVHEIVHLLEGRPVHSVSGLMRAEWSDEEIRRGSGMDWSLSGPDAVQARRGYLARLAKPFGGSPAPQRE